MHVMYRRQAGHSASKLHPAQTVKHHTGELLLRVDCSNGGWAYLTQLSSVCPVHVVEQGPRSILNLSVYTLSKAS